MPEEVRAFFEKVDFGNCLPEFADTGNTTYEYNGKKYSSFEEMPPEAQEMFRDNNQNGIPDIFEN